MAVIEVKNVKVTYRVLMNKSSSLKRLFLDALKGKARLIEYVALQDVSFTVDKGEVIAILGRNGAEQINASQGSCRSSTANKGFIKGQRQDRANDSNLALVFTLR